MNIDYFDEGDERELASGRLMVGRVVEDGAPVYFDPSTGLTSFGCGMVPIEAGGGDE